MHARRPPIAWYVFDILSLEGKNLTDQPLTERRKRLATVMRKAPAPLRQSATLAGEFEDLLAEVRKHGIEGLVGKRPSSKYESGRRSGGWIKIKVLNEQEFVIGGYSRAGGARKYFGALIVGYYEGKRLLFSSKVGTGYTEVMLRSLYERMSPLQTGDCPFVNLPAKSAGRWMRG